MNLLIKTRQTFQIKNPPTTIRGLHHFAQKIAFWLRYEIENVNSMPENPTKVCYWKECRFDGVACTFHVDVVAG